MTSKASTTVTGNQQDASNVMRQRPLLHLLAFLIAAVVASCIVANTIEPEISFEDAALNFETISVFAERDGDPIQSTKLASSNLFANRISRIRPKQSVLWLGNSQLHAINQYKEGQEPAPALAYDMFKEAGIELMTVSPPNANLREHLVVASVFFEQVGPPNAVIVPLVFDDTRDDSLRPEFEEFLRAESTIAAKLKQHVYLQSLIENIESETKSESKADGDPTWMDRSENALEDVLSKCSPAWAARGQLRASLFLDLYQMRNSAFGINAQSIRRVIPSRYESNLDAFTGLLSLAAENQVPVLAYVAPLRNDVAPPYESTEYEKFKSDVESILKQYPNHTFRNFETKVPNDLWGSKDSTNVGGEPELDFMHFQYPGHKVLADEVFSAITRILAPNDI